MIDIKKTLDILGVKEMNNGTSIGSVSFGGGRVVESISPVNGNVVGGVTETTEEEPQSENNDQSSNNDDENNNK